jgi:hypothetical protein
MTPSLFVSILAVVISGFAVWWGVVRGREEEARQERAERRLDAAEHRARETHQLALRSASSVFEATGFDFGVVEGGSEYARTFLNSGSCAARNVTASIFITDADRGIFGGPRHDLVPPGGRVTFSWFLAPDLANPPLYSEGPPQMPRVRITLAFVDDRGPQQQIFG